jgi:2,3,4,5-tetrahydropyridine-2,6-dicarboxylate N-succinyltransferase
MGESAWGDAVVTVTQAGTPLSFWFPDPRLGLPGPGEIADPVPADEREDPLRGVRIGRQVCVIADLDQPPSDTADAYLRLHLLSHRVMQPNTMNLNGIFKVLPNVGWTSLGPAAASELGTVRQRALAAGVHLEVRSVDKFPPMLDYVVPSGVRVADAARVRLGAHLAEGTTVMHEGFVNFNAGTLGSAMVEGRISQGVVVGAETDIGGGASIMGTLSGGGTQVISVGQRCLLGANSGLGISLGDDCVVEAGLYLTAGTVVTLPDGGRAKARDLSGQSGLLFRRNSITGAVEAIQRTGTWGGLSADLHAGQ